VNSDELKDATATTEKQPFRSEFAPLIDELYREEVLEARRMSPEDKFLLGGQLFDFACKITLSGIRSENPNATEVECNKILQERLKLGEWLQRHP
jgi:hypothetical protein